LASGLSNRVRELVLDPQAFVLSFFDRKQIELLLAAHTKTKALQHFIFSLVVLELWHQRFMKMPPAAGGEKTLIC
jgi:hypothetical protein